MVKPVLNPNKAVAVCDKKDARVQLLGTNLENEINEEHVKVEYKGTDVEVDKARVKSSVLIVTMKKFNQIVDSKEKEKTEEEITVTVTNPTSGDESEEEVVTLVFDEEEAPEDTE